jgi:hypothetical protein
MRCCGASARRYPWDDAGGGCRRSAGASTDLLQFLVSEVSGCPVFFRLHKFKPNLVPYHCPEDLRKIVETNSRRLSPAMKLQSIEARSQQYNKLQHTDLKRKRETLCRDAASLMQGHCASHSRRRSSEGLEVV